jgi:pimeloyl-ACP methyl ester carboxylesterase
MNNSTEQFYISEDQITIWHKLIRFYFQRIGPVMPAASTRLFWRLFTRPRKRKITKEHRFELAMANSVFYQLTGRHSKYVVHTFGKSDRRVLICHGWESRTIDFLPLINSLLSKNLEVHSIDFTGHGMAPKGRAHLPIFIDTIKEVIFGAEQSYTAVVGHSLGAAALSMALVDISHEKVKKVVFLGLHPHPSAFLLQYKYASRVNDRLFRKCIEYAERKTEVKLLEYNCQKFVQHYASFEILFIHDSYDAIINIKRIHELAGQIPVAKVFEGSHGGHFKHYKHPEVIAQLELFLKEV